MSKTVAFSPLFIGVIGATQDGGASIVFPKTFSPLFIGVIGATVRYVCQWALRICFQSPIHRGDRCNRKSRNGESSHSLFQSPIHRGDRCNAARCPRHPQHSSTFSPLFIGVIGATREGSQDCRTYKNFQSPIHRGDRCNTNVEPANDLI